MGTNTNLPDDIAVTWAKHVDDGFHARFSAKAEDTVTLFKTL